MISYFQVMPEIDITPYPSKISIPTILIVGDKDPMVPSRQSAIIADKVTNTKLSVIKGAGHLPFFERPLDYQKTLDAWLIEFPSSR